MLSILLILSLTVTFVFSFFVARALGRFLDENHTSDDRDEKLEKEDGK